MAVHAHTWLHYNRGASHEARRYGIFASVEARKLVTTRCFWEIRYRAPELLLGSAHHTGGVDAWAAGCIFAELMTLRPLFQGEEKKQPGNAFQKDQLVKCDPPCHWDATSTSARGRSEQSGNLLLFEYAP